MSSLSEDAAVVNQDISNAQRQWDHNTQGQNGEWGCHSEDGLEDSHVDYAMMELVVASKT